jgi:subtilisin family serine protease
MTVLRLSALSVVFLLAACDGGGIDAPVESAAIGTQSLTVEAGQAGDPTHWSGLTAEELWAHVAALDSTVTVGLKQPGQRRGVDEKGRSLVPRHQWRPFSNRVASLGGELVFVDDFHPLAELRISGADAIRALRRSPFVEFVEPASFDPSLALQSQCGSTSARANGSIDSEGDIIPYTLNRHKVPEAWDFTTGTGVTIGIVDTGVSVYQPQLNGQFDDGLSAGRTIQYD